MGRPTQQELATLNGHLGPDALDLEDVAGCSTDGGGLVVETRSGAVVLLHRGAAWRLNRLPDGDELVFWHNGVEVDRLVLDRRWRDVVEAGS